MFMRIRASILIAAAVWLASVHPAFALAPMPTQAELDAARAQAANTPDSADAHFQLAMLYARTCFLEQGWEELKRVNVIDPAYADKVVARYAPLAPTGPLVGAATAADPGAYFRLAFGYYFQNKKDLARQTFAQYVGLAPDDPWGYDYLGFLYAEQNQLDAALQLWQKAVALDPNNAVAHYLIGQVFYRQGHFIQAAQSLTTAVRLRASSPLHP
jgi:tetratricopeptide (TPR) repeat protein